MGPLEARARAQRRQGGSTLSRRATTTPPACGLEEVDLAERFTQSLLEDASEGY